MKPIFYINEHYYYDYSQGILFFDKKPIKLSKKEILLLKLLINEKEQLVTYKEIKYYLWENDKVKHDTLRALVYRFRKKLEQNFIETVPSFGYKLKI